MPHHLAADGVVRAVDGDVHRAQPLLHNALQVALAQVGDCDVVAVEERHPEVAVAEVERVAEANRILIHETEQAIVATGLDAELFQLRPERVVDVLGDVLHLQVPVAADAQLQCFLSSLEAKIQFVFHGIAVHGDDLIAGLPAELFGERSGFYGGDANGQGVIT